MRVLISGASGLVGSALRSALADDGHTVARIVRGTAAGGDVAWDTSAGTFDRKALEGFDAVIHLAGENIGGGRWTAARKDAIRRSRVDGTKSLARALASLTLPPRVLVAASAIGLYGDRGDEILTESSPPGVGFLADVCREWEAAAAPAAARGIRVVHARFGIILSPAGGALMTMLRPFRLGFGGPLGGGRQWMSWVTLGDVVGALRKVIGDETLTGPVNVTSPAPVRQRVFAKALGRALRRPAFLPTPAFAVRLAFGEMADALLLGSAHVRPARLEAAGYRFAGGEIEAALRSLL